MPDNLGTGGSALNAQNGSSSGSDTNEALYLAADTVPYVYFPGSGAQYLEVTHSSALNITGDIEFILRIGMDSWNSGALQGVASKANAGTAWRLFVTSTGLLEFGWWDSGGTLRTRLSTVATGFSAGQVKWLKVNLDVNNGASGHDVKFFTGDDGTTWTQLGTTVTTAGVTTVGTSSDNVFVGRASGNNGALKVYRFILKNGIDGTTVCDVNTSVLTSGSATSFTEQSSNAANVSIVRTTSGRKAVAVVSGPRWLFGTDDYMQVADNNLLDFGASDSFSVVAVVRQWNTPTDLGIIVSKSDGYDNGYAMVNSGTTANWRALIDLSGTEVTRNSAYTAGSPHVRTMVVDRAAQTLVAWTNSTATASTSTSTVGSLANALPLRIGRSGGTTTGYQDFELMAVAVFRRTLTTAEITAISSYYQARYP